MEELFDALQCSKEWKVGLAVFYLKNKVDLWWPTVREKQYEPGFDWRRFKELIKDHFYPVTLQKAKENELMQLQQERMSMLEYAPKFMKLSCFTPAFVADERLSMIRFEAGHTLTSRKGVGASVNLLRGLVRYRAQYREGNEGEKQLLQ